MLLIKSTPSTIATTLLTSKLVTSGCFIFLCVIYSCEFHKVHKITFVTDSVFNFIKKAPASMFKFDFSETF